MHITTHSLFFIKLFREPTTNPGNVTYAIKGNLLPPTMSFSPHSTIRPLLQSKPSYALISTSYRAQTSFCHLSSIPHPSLVTQGMPAVALCSHAPPFRKLPALPLEHPLIISLNAKLVFLMHFSATIQGPKTKFRNLNIIHLPVTTLSLPFSVHSAKNILC